MNEFQQIPLNFEANTQVKSKTSNKRILQSVEFFYILVVICIKLQWVRRAFCFEYRVNFRMSAFKQVEDNEWKVAPWFVVTFLPHKI